MPPARETATSAVASASPKCVGLREQDVARPRDAGAERLVVALTRDMEHRGPVPGPGADRELVERPRAGERTEDGDDRSLHGQPEAAPPLPLRRASMGERDGSPDDAHFPSRPSGDLVREQQHLRERRGEPVREAEVCVRFGHRRRDAAKPCRDDHRAGDVAACAEDDVGPASAQDREAVRRRRRGLPGSANLGGARSPWEAGDRERVEREPRLRHQPRLDAVGRPGERHGHSAGAQSLPDCECRTNVPGRSPGRDHARELRRRAHSPRC